MEKPQHLTAARRPKPSTLRLMVRGTRTRPLPFSRVFHHHLRPFTSRCTPGTCSARPNSVPFSWGSFHCHTFPTSSVPSGLAPPSGLHADATCARRAPLASAGSMRPSSLSWGLVPAGEPYRPFCSSPKEVIAAGLAVLTCVCPLGCEILGAARGFP